MVSLTRCGQEQAQDATVVLKRCTFECVFDHMSLLWNVLYRKMSQQYIQMPEAGSVRSGDAVKTGFKEIWEMPLSRKNQRNYTVLND